MAKMLKVGGVYMGAFCTIFYFPIFKKYVWLFRNFKIEYPPILVHLLTYPYKKIKNILMP